MTYGFLVQWPTLPTLMMFPILILAYYRLARGEERELELRFGDEYAAYRARTPMLPGWPVKARTTADEESCGRWLCGC